MHPRSINQFLFLVFAGGAMGLLGCQTKELAPTLGDRCVRSEATLRWKVGEKSQTAITSLVVCPQKLELQGFDPLGRTVLSLSINEDQYEFHNHQETRSEKGRLRPNFLAQRFKLAIPVPVFMQALRDGAYPESLPVSLQNDQWQEVKGIRLPMVQTFRGVAQGPQGKAVPVELVLRYRKRDLDE